MILPPRDFSKIMGQPFPPALEVRELEGLIPGIPDGLVALAAPVIAYWVLSIFFHILDVYELAEKYRIHPSEEETSRNKVTMKEVIREVLLQHFLQTVAGLVVYFFEPKQKTGFEMSEMWYWKQKVPFAPDILIWFAYMYGISTIKILVAFCVIDTWQYFLHRLMHLNKTLYRKFHSVHHRLYVPYAFGALYNNPVEGLLLDTASGGLGGLLACLTQRESIIMYTVATMKTVDDHCGFRLPFDVFYIIFPNNSLYHDIHHQQWGIKNNFSQPFLTFWDCLGGTDYKFADEYKQLQHKSTLDKYKEFLQKKENKKRMHMSKTKSD